MNNNLQIVKSQNFGNVQCDIYSNGNECYMTREQIGTALEYSDPMVAIGKIHDRYEARLKKYSFTKLVNGRNTYFYTRKGIMEICRFSRQQKADAFMDWVWDIMDGIITGELKVKSPTRKPKISEVNTMARNYAKLAKSAGMKPQFIMVAVQRMYALAGVEIPTPTMTVEHQLFDAATIAEKIGIYSKSGNPHIQAVSAIIAQLDIDEDEKTAVPFQNAQNGHAGTNWQYTESVIVKIVYWLRDNDYPQVIEHNGKGFKVTYTVPKQQQLLTASV